MISKKTLLKEFTAEIEKLKSELIATRQRNGVYLSNEQYEEITVESESRRILADEQKSRIETMETSLRNKVQELFNLTNNLTGLKRDNESTRATLDSTKDVLFKTAAVLKDTQEMLEDETALRKAHQETEGRLLNMGTGLISTIDTSVKDLDAVHAKLRRRSDLHHQNQQVWQSSITHIGQAASSTEQHLANFQQTHARLVTKSSQRLQAFVSQETLKLDTCKRMILEKTSELEKSQATVEEQSTTARDGMNDVLEEIKVLREEVKEKVGEGLKGLNHAAAKISGEVIAELEQFHAQLHTSYSSLGKEFKTMFEGMTKQLTAQREENDRLRTELQEAQRRNLEASRSASRQLQTCLNEEKRVAQQERQQLKDQISALIDASASRQEDRISHSLSEVHSQLEESSEAFEQAGAAYAQGMDAWALQDQSLMEGVVKSKEDLKARMKRDWTVRPSYVSDDFC